MLGCFYAVVSRCRNHHRNLSTVTVEQVTVAFRSSLKYLDGTFIVRIHIPQIRRSKSRFKCWKKYTFSDILQWRFWYAMSNVLNELFSARLWPRLRWRCCSSGNICHEPWIRNSFPTRTTSVLNKNRAAESEFRRKYRRHIWQEMEMYTYLNSPSWVLTAGASGALLA